jgi:hypothetical protein
MRMRLVSSLLLLAAAPAFAESCEKVAYGAGVTLVEPTAVAAILDTPASFTGKEVRVEGTVKEVCEMAGCWMELQAGEGPRTLKVKVKDGDIVFPVAARGKQAVAQGKVEDLEMNRGKYVQYMKHAAEEQGGTFDEASLKGDGPFHVYQIAGTGAEICK